MLHPLIDDCYRNLYYPRTGVGRPSASPSPLVVANALAQGLCALKKQRELKHTRSHQIVAVLSSRNEIHAPFRFHT